jgi:hypothetical protein
MRCILSSMGGVNPAGFAIALGLGASSWRTSRARSYDARAAYLGLPTPALLERKRDAWPLEGVRLIEIASFVFAL